MSIPASVIELIERFERNKDAYRSGKYNEAQVRQEFVNPLFMALKWDVYNTQGFAEAYKDVIHEDAIKVRGGVKAPDYCFRVGGAPKFFVEAKKPSVRLKDDISAAFQLRTYAWSAKLPLSILTDFEEFAVYDGRFEPDKNDKASKARVLYLTYDQYPDAWDDRIGSIFSREAVLKGDFDRFAESNKAKRGTTEVDAAFLQEIERWRELLARNMALRNPGLSQRDLNFAVQRTIDRIIFLRICEDRGIEDYGRLQALFNGTELYPRLCELFRQADEKYNSGLFHFSTEKGRNEAPDELTLGLVVDDDKLKQILHRLYYPDSPYQFSVLPADILGQVYEQFLGKVIRLTAGHQAKIEDKPEVKKAGGVFYTPTYIVEYIAENTVGKLIEGMTPARADKLRILDPACGSGSFLIGAYQKLLDWRLQQYSREPDKHKKRLYQGSGGELRLTTEEKKRILLNNIFGVDIDPQAVEVTKLSLLLKVLEGETEQTLNRQLELYRQRALPDLSRNIKCGNSLIGPDFYDNRQMDLLDGEERYRVNVFDWAAEFPEVFGGRNPGFDAVIGNPPYVRQEGLGESKEYFLAHYKTFKSTADLYVNFIEKGLGLLNPDGLFGMIVSNKWLRAAYGRDLREFLARDAEVRQIVDLAGLPVFQNATVRTVVLICAPQPSRKRKFKYLPPPPAPQFKAVKSGDGLQALFDSGAVSLDLARLSADEWSLAHPGVDALIEKLRAASVPLERYVDGMIYRGVLTGLNKAFIIDREQRDRLVAQDPRNAEIIKPLLGGRDIRRYHSVFKDKHLIFARRGINIENYPAILEYLEQFRRDLTPKKDRKDKYGRKPGNYQWYEIQDSVDYYQEFEKPKIVYSRISPACRFSLDSDGCFSLDTTFIIACGNLYLLGLLNSSLSFFYFSKICAALEGGGEAYLEFRRYYVEKFPVRAVDESDSEAGERHSRMVELVERMLELNSALKAVSNPHERTALERQVKATDARIDALVYELYGLTRDEIALVESAS